MEIEQQKKNIIKWMYKKFPELGGLKEFKKFDTGQSNPTYKLNFENKKLVLRSQPEGKLLRGAHRIDREFRVMSCLKNTKIPVPNMKTYCEDINIIGRDFYIMEFVDGIQEVDPILTKIPSNKKKQLYYNKLDILINLGQLNLKQLNLHDYGKQEKYMERQLNLWINQYKMSETKTINSMEFLIEKLVKHLPDIFDKLPVILCHGDFRIDNMILDKKDKNKVIALIDWELSTLGIPFIDLSYWCLMLRFSNTWAIKGLGDLNKNKTLENFPSEKNLFEKYSNILGFDIQRHWNYLLGFNCFRFASILQGIAKRVLDGNNAGNNASEVGELAEPVANMGELLIKDYI